MTTFVFCSGIWTAIVCYDIRTTFVFCCDIRTTLVVFFGYIWATFVAWCTLWHYDNVCILLWHLDSCCSLQWHQDNVCSFLWHQDNFLLVSCDIQTTFVVFFFFFWSHLDDFCSLWHCDITKTFVVCCDISTFVVCCDICTFCSSVQKNKIKKGCWKRWLRKKILLSRHVDNMRTTCMFSSFHFFLFNNNHLFIVFKWAIFSNFFFGKCSNILHCVPLKCDRLWLFAYFSLHYFVACTPEGRPGMSDVSPCLESQGCHLIPVCYLLSCSSA